MFGEGEFRGAFRIIGVVLVVLIVGAFVLGAVIF